MNMAICEWCEKDMLEVDDCAMNRVVRYPNGDLLASSTFHFDEPNGRCHDCGIIHGNYHHPGCDVERCPRCKGQLISCGCLYEDGYSEKERVKMTLPKTTQQSILHVDATPDADCPLQILRTYRANCDVKWIQQAGEPSALLAMMNDSQDERAAILDKVIALLEGVKGEVLQEMKQTIIKAIYSEDGLDGVDGVSMISCINLMLGLDTTDNNPPDFEAEEN